MKKIRYLKRLVFLATVNCSLIVLSACNAFGPIERSATDAMLGSYGSETFRAAFHAGCQSGYRDAGNPYNPYNKNRDMYEVNGDYKRGWDEGYDRCFKRYSSIPNP